MSDVLMASAGTEEEARNKATVLAFYEAVIKGRQFHRIGEWLDDTYVQHRPGLEDGPDPIIDFVKKEVDRNPTHQVVIKKCFADGDYVVLHVHIVLAPQEPDRAVMDIFRVKNGRLLEHWDVDQQIPGTVPSSRMF
jgi:predicted SnoaL-like aldol condensation-catalyzing enzyme